MTDLDEVKRFRAGVFGRGARDYDRVGSGPTLAELGRRLVELAGIEPGDRVLDVATGRGAVLFAAAERVGEGGSVVGMDLAPEMVELLSEDITAREITNAEARLGDAEDLRAFGDGEFDCVACAFAIFFLPDPERTLREFHRVLRPAGTVAVSSWANPDDPRHEWYGELRREFGVTVSLETRSFDDPVELEEALTTAGFEGVVVSTQRVTFRLDGPEEWWRWLNSVGGRATVEALDPPERERFREEAFERIRAVYDSGIVEIEDEALFAIARKPS